MITEARREEIRKEAREILDKFAKTLEGLPEPRIVKKGAQKGFREESSGKGCDEDFRKRMFENAPNVKGDCIVAEKAGW